MGWGRRSPWVHLAPWGWQVGRGLHPPTKGPLLSSLDPQVRLEQIRQAESLEQVRSIMDEAPLRDIRDIKDT